MAKDGHIEVKYTVNQICFNGINGTYVCFWKNVTCKWVFGESSLINLSRRKRLYEKQAFLEKSNNCILKSTIMRNDLNN